MTSRLRLTPHLPPIPLSYRPGPEVLSRGWMLVALPACFSSSLTRPRKPCWSTSASSSPQVLPLPRSSRSLRLARRLRIPIPQSVSRGEDQAYGTFAPSNLVVRRGCDVGQRDRGGLYRAIREYSHATLGNPEGAIPQPPKLSRSCR